MFLFSDLPNGGVNHYPHLILCRFNGFKGPRSPFIFDEIPVDNFTGFVDEHAITKPSQIIHKLDVATRALGEKRQLDVDTYFTPELSDLLFMGYCFKSDINRILADDGG